jgi:hypothetical protein
MVINYKVEVLNTLCSSGGAAVEVPQWRCRSGGAEVELLAVFKTGKK